MEPMILEGPVLIFDKPSMNGFVFPKGSIIEIPEKIPVVWDYKFGNPELVIGFAELDIRDDCIWATVMSTNELFRQIMKDRERIFCGGYYYNSVISHSDNNGLRVVTKAKLLGLGVYEAGDEFLYLKVKEK